MRDPALEIRPALNSDAPAIAGIYAHESMGFQPAGVHRVAGYKLGDWRYVGWWQLALREPPEQPDVPRLWTPEGA